MRRLTALLLLTLLALSPRAGMVLFQMPGADSQTFESTTVNGVEHLPLEDLITVLRLVDPQMLVSWDSTQSLRFTVLDTKISLFTDSASVLVETQLHRTDGPLLSNEGQMLVPASVMRDLFEYLPAAPQVVVTLPSRQINPTVVTEPQHTVIPAPTIDPMIEPLPTNLPMGTLARPVSGPIALVAISQSDGDAALLEATVEALSDRIAMGTGRDVAILEATAGRWEPVAVALQEIGPSLVIALQVGHSPEDELRGVGIYHMSPLVDSPTGMTSIHGRRYRALARMSEVLSLHLENELRQINSPWLGRTPAPHRLLKIITGPVALVEIGQASNRDEASALTEAPLSAALAGAMAQAVIDFQAQIRAQEASL